MKSNDPPKQPSGTRLYFILAMVLLGLAAAGLNLWLRGTPSPSTASQSRVATLQINVPTVQYPTIAPSAPEFTVSIQSVANSGVTGTATFKDIAGVVAILLQVEGLPDDEEHESIVPVELHYGTCAGPGDLAYSMTSPDAGQSETDLSINLKDFISQEPMVILLYRSAQDRTVIGCGEVQ